MSFPDLNTPDDPRACTVKRGRRHSPARVIGPTASATPVVAPSDLLTTDALVLRYPWFRRGYWARLRCRGDGPAFLRVGGTILYRESVVLAWLDAHTVTSTSEAKCQRAAA